MLIRGTIAAARNALGLLYDVRVLAQAGSAARAHSLAAVAVEEAGKASSPSILTMVPEPDGTGRRSAGCSNGTS